jgi:hypothetical protein
MTENVHPFVLFSAFVQKAESPHKQQARESTPQRSSCFLRQRKEKERMEQTGSDHKSLRVS